MASPPLDYARPPSKGPDVRSAIGSMAVGVGGLLCMFVAAIIALDRYWENVPWEYSAIAGASALAVAAWGSVLAVRDIRSPNPVYIFDLVGILLNGLLAWWGLACLADMARRLFG